MHKRNIVLLCLITFLQGMVFYAAVATLYRQAAGLSIFEITAIEGISVAMALALEVPWGRIAERIGYRHTMVVCNLLFLLCKNPVIDDVVCVKCGNRIPKNHVYCPFCGYKE